MNKNVNVMKIKYMFGLNFWIYLIVFVMLKSWDILGFLEMVEEVKL